MQSVPVLARGRQFTFAQSTKQIVDFLGLGEETAPGLPPDELIRRLDKFMAAALQLLPLMPQDRLATHVPGRPRSYRSLAFHLFRVVDAFLDANSGITLVRAMFAEEPASDAGTNVLAEYGGSIRQRFDAWRSAGDLAADEMLPTYYGPQTRHELLERTTWHCGQHVRQWMMLLEKEGVSHPRPLVEGDFQGLPMPQNVWDG
ncbi:DinB family protein [Desertibaculum subflavum]|uniref:DinB family protein n=1 Tax=Desertibaculum subflavum TaxID=2268458 RepID=UPI000E66D9C9